MPRRSITRLCLRYPRSSTGCCSNKPREGDQLSRRENPPGKRIRHTAGGGVLVVPKKRHEDDEATSQDRGTVRKADLDWPIEDEESAADERCRHDHGRENRADPRERN